MLSFSGQQAVHQQRHQRVFGLGHRLSCSWLCVSSNANLDANCSDMGTYMKFLVKKEIPTIIIQLGMREK